jgi:hypothetical protein
MTDETRIIEELIYFAESYKGIKFPDDNTKVTWANYVILSYLIDNFEYAPRLNITASTIRCGKSKLLSTTCSLAKNGIAMIKPSAASLFRVIDKEQPGILGIDEMDKVWNNHVDNAAILDILNSGFDRESPPVRRVNTDRNEVDRFNVFGLIAFAGIRTDKLPTDIQDRIIEINLRRRPIKDRGKRVKKEVIRQEQKRLIELMEHFANWVTQHVKDIGNPSLPKEIEETDNERFIDKWEGLISIGDLVDLYENNYGVTDETPVTPVTPLLHIGINGYKVRNAAIAAMKVDKEKEIDQTDNAVLIINHIEDIFDKKATYYLLPDDLVSELNRIHDAPWHEFNDGTGITVQRGIMSLLKRHQIKQKSERIDGIPTKVYLKDHFKKAFEDYPRPYI